MQTVSFTEKDLARFWAKVAKSDDCWLWQGKPTVRGGYGQFNVGGKVYAAHRIAYELERGLIPEGLRIDHKCHTPMCVNPKHLRIVTVKQNAENYGSLLATNTSGVRGVFWHTGGKKWSVQVTHNGKRYSGGLHKELWEAETAAVALRSRLHTHNDLDRADHRHLLDA